MPEPPEQKPPAFVHVDLDGLWTLAAAYGFDEGTSFSDDPVYSFAADRLLGLFSDLNIPATFFLIGRDLTIEPKRSVAARIASAGHELANHSFSHRFDLEDSPEGVALDEIQKTNALIEQAAGSVPHGFRAPGYSAGPRLLEAARHAGLRYDGSTLPTYWGRALRSMASGLRSSVGIPGTRAKVSKRLYGGDNGLRPLGPNHCRWFGEPSTNQNPNRILRIPVAVSPHLRLPLQASMGIVWGSAYTGSALRRLAEHGGPITYLLHGLDALGAEELQGRIPGALLRSRGMRFTLAQRMKFLRETLSTLARVTTIEPTWPWVERRLGK